MSIEGDDMFWILFEIAFNLLDAGLDLFLFTRLFAPKRKDASQWLPIILTGIISFGWLSSASLLHLSIFPGLVVSVLIRFLFLLLFREGHWQGKLFFVLLSMAMFGAISYSVVQLLSIAQNVNIADYYTNTNYRFFSITIIHLLYICYITLVTHL